MQKTHGICDNLSTRWTLIDQDTMVAKRSSAVQQLQNLVALSTILSVVLATATHRTATGYPTSISAYAHADQLEKKVAANEDSAERQSFQQFIRSKLGSTIIGELKPNASERELVILKDKIAQTILNFQALEKAPEAAQQLEPASVRECFIEVTRVERLSGKCNKVNNGIPVCQSDNYMALNNECM